MIKASFPIAITRNDKLVRVDTVDGFKTDDISLFGIHRSASRDPWTVTFLPVGTRVDSLFVTGLRKYRDPLLERIAWLENLHVVEFGAISDLPYGTHKIPDPLRWIVRRVIDTVKANP